MAVARGRPLHNTRIWSSGQFSSQLGVAGSWCSFSYWGCAARGVVFFLYIIKDGERFHGEVCFLQLKDLAPRILCIVLWTRKIKRRSCVRWLALWIALNMIFRLEDVINRKTSHAIYLWNCYSLWESACGEVPNVRSQFLELVPLRALCYYFTMQDYGVGITS